MLHTCQNTWRPTTRCHNTRRPKTWSQKACQSESETYTTPMKRNAKETQRQTNTTPNTHNAKKHDAKQHNTKKHNATRNTAPQWNNGRRQKPNATSPTQSNGSVETSKACKHRDTWTHNQQAWAQLLEAQFLPLVLENGKRKWSFENWNLNMIFTNVCEWTWDKMHTSMHNADIVGNAECHMILTRDDNMVA